MSIKYYYKLNVVWRVVLWMYVADVCGGLWYRLVSDGLVCTVHCANYTRVMLITVLLFYQNYNQNYMILTVEWSWHTINLFLFLHLPSWRWPHESYIIKLLLPYNKITFIKPQCTFFDFKLLPCSKCRDCENYKNLFQTQRQHNESWEGSIENFKE